jgi:hypothetical protein
MLSIPPRLLAYWLPMMLRKLASLRAVHRHHWRLLYAREAWA